MENEYDSVYEDLSSLHDEELSETDNNVSDSAVNESEQDVLTSESDDTLLDSEGSQGDDSHEDLYSSSILETSSSVCESVNTPAVTIDGSTAETSSFISDNEYLYGIYSNTSHCVVFEFVIILLLVLVFFSRFLNNLIL